MPLLQQAQARHIPVPGFGFKNAPLILEKLGVRAYFATIVDPDSLSKGKPDPEIFLAAADSIGVLPQNAIGFEDAQSGIDGESRGHLCRRLVGQPTLNRSRHASF